MRKLVAGLIVLVFSIVLDALLSWSLIAQSVATLRTKGSVGMFIADLITSPILRLSISVVGLTIAVKGLLENRAAVRSVQVPNALPPLADSREILGVTPRHLMSFFGNHTSVQAEKLIAPFIGKWISISGGIFDIYPDGDTRSITVFIFQPTGAVSCHLYFDKEWTDRVSVLDRNQKIRVLGKIRSVYPTSMTLDECELLDSLRGEFFVRQIPKGDKPQ